MREPHPGDNLVAGQSGQTNDGTKPPSDGKRWIGFLYFVGTVGFIFVFFYVLGLLSD
jgi:hypothetical protein